MRRTYAVKIWFVTAALIVFSGGLAITLLLFFSPELGGFMSQARQWLQTFLPRFLADPATHIFRICLSFLVNLIELAAAVLIAVPAGSLISRTAARKGEFSPYGRFCLCLGRQGVSAGCNLVFFGLFFILSALYLTIHYLGSTLVLYQFHLIIEFGLSAILLGLGILAPVPLLLSDPEPMPADTTAPIPQKSPARCSGKDLLERLRQSPVFRRQITSDITIRAFPFIADDQNILDVFLSHYPLIGRMLSRTGIEVLTNAQATALKAILQEESSEKFSKDYSFIGWPGSGRTTLANLLAVAAVLHKRGSIYFSTAENALHHLDNGAEPHITGRHPATQLRQWLKAARLEENIQVEEAYTSTSTGNDLNLTNTDIVFSDANILSTDLLSGLKEKGFGFISRLRYVVIDHPERLRREDLVRLRISIARLRITAELLGSRLTFIVLLPRINNHQAFSKFLLNNSDIDFFEFSTWPGKAHLVGWLPPLELLDFDSDQPRLVRSGFTSEAIDLLAEIGYQSNQLPRPLRVGIIDATPLLGPEARSYIRDRVRVQLGRETDQDVITITNSWHYFSTADIGVNGHYGFDVVVALGIGSHPEHLVATIRQTLAADGLIFLVGDSSQADIESLQEIDATPNWDPMDAIVEIEYPSTLIPEHSEAIIAHELALLLENLDIPLSEQRLREVFPGAATARLLENWAANRRIETVTVFERYLEDGFPRRKAYIRRCDPDFRGEAFRIPWGCCSRKVYGVSDQSARRTIHQGARHGRYIDLDRLFIDFFPRAILRDPPNTLKVTGRQERQIGAEERRLLNRRYVKFGDVQVATLPFDAAVGIDRRKPRIDTALLTERPLASMLLPEMPAGLETLPPISAVLRIGTAADDQGLLDFPDPEKRKELFAHAIAGSLLRPLIGSARQAPQLAITGGVWVANVRETIRDVVKTDHRLVEEPFLTQRITIPGAETPSREYRCISVNLFLEKTGSFSEKADTPEATALAGAFGSYAAFHALARLMAAFLRRKYLRFDMNFRVVVIAVENTAVDTISNCRIVFYHLRQDEVGSGQTGIQDQLLEPGNLKSILTWAHARLASCDCEDGCVRCCGGLGAIPEHLLPYNGFSERDAVSRKGAYLLVCALLGRAADLGRFRRKTRPDTKQPWTQNELSRFVVEIMGTPENDFRDGVWFRLFNGWMRFNAEMIVPARWMSEEEEAESAVAGFYRPNSEVVLRTNLDEQFVREVLVHEFTHNWQYKGGHFNFPEHSNELMAKYFFNGKLVIEGHATWAENQYRFSKGMGASYVPGDARPWNEYKVGYFLFENIEKAVGESGLFAWLKDGSNSTASHIRSKDPRLKWPFNLGEALQAFDLLETARNGSFSNPGIREEDTSSDKPKDKESIE